MGVGYGSRSQGGGMGATCANHTDRPADALCSRCGDFVCGACYTLSAQGDILCNGCSTSQLVREPLAWEEREELGVVNAYWETTKGILFRPFDYLKRIEPHGPYGPAIVFSMISSFILGVGMACQTGAQFVAMSGADQGSGFGGLGAGGNPLMGEGLLAILGMMVGMVVVVPFINLGTSFITAGILHLAAMIVGAAQNGYRATYRMLAYLSALQVVMGALGLLTAVIGVWHVYAFMAMSVLSQLLQLGLGMYILVLWAFGLKEVHETTIGRGLGAVGVFFGLGIVTCCGFYALIILFVMTAAGL